MFNYGWDPLNKTRILSKVSPEGITSVSADAVHTWGFMSGFNSDASIKGVTSDWIFARGATEDFLATAGAPITSLTTLVNTLGYQGFASGSVWVYIPIAEKGYRSFCVNLTSTLVGGAAKVTAFAVPENIKPLPGGIINTVEALTTSFIIIKDALIPVDAGSQLTFGPGGSDLNLYPAVPIGGLILKMTRATTAPTSGLTRLFISRQK